ncbi:hypothetical protein OG21DRAFT_1496339, partial [Imleria badia]
MDDEIIDVTLSNLKIQRSAVCFISRLPTETLEAIFIHRACDNWHHSIAYGPPLPFQWPRLAAPGWVDLSYVCRHWRNIALNCPTLWTYLFMTTPRWTEAFLRRSKQASLKLAVHVEEEDEHLALRFVEQVVKHSERIQDLRIHLWADAYQ